MSITGEGPGRPPVKGGPPITDITAGLLAAMGVAAAYAHKLKTGQGQRVDTSLFEAGITPDLLAVGHRLRHRRFAGTARVGPSPERALPGVRDQGRLDHARRLEPEDLAGRS